MTPSSRLASVVIPTFNRRMYLDQVIAPLLSDPGTGEIVVVVDGSQDQSFELLEEWSRREPRIRPFYQENAGPSAARRRGVLESRFDTVVMIDDDVVADVGLIESHVQRHLHSDRLLVLGYMPTHVATPRRPWQVATYIYAQAYEDTCTIYENSPTDIFAHLWGGNVSIRRANALAVGSDREIRLDYHEDLRFGLRSQTLGLQPVFDRSLRATHMHHRNLRRFSLECRRSGEARAHLSREYPRISSAMDPGNAPTLKERLIAQYLAGPLLGPIASRLTMGASYLAGAACAWRMETLFARLLQCIEVSYGYQVALKAQAESLDGPSAADFERHSSAA